MDIISYVHKSVELLFHILGLVEVWTRRSMELSPLSGRSSDNRSIIQRYQIIRGRERKGVIKVRDRRSDTGRNNCMEGEKP